MLRFLRSRLSGIGVVVLLLLAWQEASLHGVVDRAVVPPVTDVLHAWVDAMADGSLGDALTSTLERFAIGYTLAVVLGVSIGVLLGRWRTMYALLEPTVELLRPIPSPAIVPAFILVLGIENRMKIAVVVFASCFAVIVNTTLGVRGVDPVLLDTARTFGYGGAAVVWRVILPAALPAIFAGMRISLAVALIVTIVAEMQAGGDGMGVFILNAQSGFAAQQMYAGILTLGAVGYILNWLFVGAERLVLPWYGRQNLQ
jgi:ABC-type nitrate/sulfonate/bicarbonate transport system permease component